MKSKANFYLNSTFVINYSELFSKSVNAFTHLVKSGHSQLALLEGHNYRAHHRCPSGCITRDGVHVPLIGQTSMEGWWLVGCGKRSAQWGTPNPALGLWAHRMSSTRTTPPSPDLSSQLLALRQRPLRGIFLYDFGDHRDLDYDPWNRFSVHAHLWSTGPYFRPMGGVLREIRWGCCISVAYCLVER